MRIKVNILDYTMGDILSIEYKDGRQRPVAFLSKSLDRTKRNYKIHDKKMLVVIRGFINQRYLLEGTKLMFEVWIDYKNLEYFIKMENLNRR